MFGADHRQKLPGTVEVRLKRLKSGLKNMMLTPEQLKSFELW